MPVAAATLGLHLDVGHAILVIVCGDNVYPGYIAGKGRGVCSATIELGRYVVLTRSTNIVRAECRHGSSPVRNCPLF